MKNNKRKYKRMLLSGYSAQFVENNSFYTGVIEDISIKGLRVRVCRLNSKIMSGNTVPWFSGSLIRTSTEYKVAVMSNQHAIDAQPHEHPKTTNQTFRLTVQPRWRKKKGHMIKVGFDIVTSPTNWHLFIRKISSGKKLLTTKPALQTDPPRVLPSPFKCFGGIHCPKEGSCKGESRINELKNKINYTETACTTYKKTNRFLYEVNLVYLDGLKKELKSELTLSEK